MTTGNLFSSRKNRRILTVVIFTVFSVVLFFLFNRSKIVQYGQSVHTSNIWKLETLEALRNGKYESVTKKQMVTEAKRTAKMFITCYKTPSHKNSFPEFRYDFTDTRKRIFFLETSCSSDKSLSKLNCRQACAVESAAKSNPNMLVNLLFISSSPPSNRTKHLLKLVSSYKNVQVSRIFFDEYIKDTPIDGWFSTDLLENSPWPLIDMSDMLRHITMWKFGGVYLDLDVILMKSLDDLSNFVVAESSDLMASSSYGLSSESEGRKFADACVQDMKENFRNYYWTHIGPSLMTRVVKKFCGETSIVDTSSSLCKDMSILPPSSFSPVHWTNWKNYFTDENLNETMRLIKNARGIHFWNHLSGSKIFQTHQRVPLTLVAEKYCPLTFKDCGPTF